CRSWRVVAPRAADPGGLDSTPAQPDAAAAGSIAGLDPNAAPRPTCVAGDGVLRPAVARVLRGRIVAADHLSRRRILGRRRRVSAVLRDDHWRAGRTHRSQPR